jgi:hypothetical protein
MTTVWSGLEEIALHMQSVLPDKQEKPFLHLVAAFTMSSLTEIPILCTPLQIISYLSACYVLQGAFTAD